MRKAVHDGSDVRTMFWNVCQCELDAELRAAESRGFLRAVDELKAYHENGGMFTGISLMSRWRDNYDTPARAEATTDAVAANIT